MEDIEVSGKHIKLRFVIFIIALIVGVSAFAIGIYQITNKETGYYEIKATADETAPLYSNGYSFFCFVDGKSDDIKSNLTKIASLYSESLGRISRLLDPVETYDGYVNLATLNQHPGEDVKLPAELYAVLTDALARSEAGGFDLFDGAEKALWQEVLYLEDAEAFDPEIDPYQYERMVAAWTVIRGADRPTLTVVDEASGTVRLEVSAAYREVMERHEIEAPILDFGVLREAYTLQYVRQKLIENGFSKGYLRSVSGMNVMLPQTEAGILKMYGYLDGKAVAAAEITLGKGAACCELRSFSMGEAGYYTIDGILRHPYPGREWEPSRDILTVWTTSTRGDIVDAAVKALSLYAATPEDAKQLLIDFGTKQTSAALLSVNEPLTIYSDPLHTEKIVPNTDGGYTVSTPDA